MFPVTVCAWAVWGLMMKTKSSAIANATAPREKIFWENMFFLIPPDFATKNGLACDFNRAPQTAALTVNRLVGRSILLRDKDWTEKLFISTFNEQKFWQS